jgi:pimeloyl-ACP methyl ester carboxylesterase
MAMIFDAGDGRMLSYTRRGAGPLVVCVPGGPGMDPEAYFASADLPGHELLIFAPRGTGESSRPDPPDAYRMADYVSDVEALRTHLGLERLTVYGNSHGGCVALAYAARHPARVSRFIVTNSPHGMGEGYDDAVAAVTKRFGAAFDDGQARLQAAEAAWPAIAAAADESERRRHFRTSMAGYVARLGPAETAYVDRLCSAPMNFESVDVMSAEFEGGLELLDGAAAIDAPALVIGCEFDVTVPAGVMRETAAALPSGRYFEITGAGHFPEVEAGPEFTRVVLDFLASTPVTQ